MLYATEQQLYDIKNDFATAVKIFYLCDERIPLNMQPTDTTEGRKILHTTPPRASRSSAVVFVPALDQQIIENGVLHSARVTSCLFIFSSQYPSGMPRKSRCLAASPATPRSSFLLSSRSRLAEGFSRGGRARPSSPSASSLAPGRKNRCEKTRLRAIPVRERHRERKGKRGGSIEMPAKKKERKGRRTVSPRISELTLNH